MRYVWLVLLVGCGSAKPTPNGETATPPAMAFGVVDLRPFMPDIVPIIETLAGEPTYAFRRGDDVFPLVARGALESDAPCLPGPYNPAAWVFPDGSVFMPNEGVFWRIEVIEGEHCWRSSRLQTLSAFEASATPGNGESFDEHSLSVPLTSGDKTHVATLKITDFGALSFGDLGVAVIAGPAPWDGMPEPHIEVTLTLGRYARAGEVFHVAASAEDVHASMRVDWQGTTSTTQLAQWLFVNDGQDISSVVTFTEAKGLPLKSGATLDLEGNVVDHTEDRHVGSITAYKREARVRLSAAGKSIALWPEAPVSSTIERDLAVPSTLTSSGCTVQFASDADSNIVVRCETEHVLQGPDERVDDETMRVNVADHAHYLSISAERHGDGGGQFIRKWLVPKRGGTPLLVSVSDIEQ